MAQTQGPSAAKRAAGAALMLLGVALIGYGTHYLARNGTCSGTGYSQVGPVPTCSGPEALYITATFFAGPALALAGWMMAQLWGWLWPAVCICAGVGLATIELDSSASSGARSFGLVAGVPFFALAVVSVIRTWRKRKREQAALANSPLAQAYQVGQAARPAQAGLPVASARAPIRSAGDYLPVTDQIPVMSGPTSDPLETIAKLAQLRDSGALTEAEYEREKAKLLRQI
jgi:hypothetical protein